MMDSLKLAVPTPSMIDARDALDVGPGAAAVEWSGYVESWKGGAAVATGTK